MNDRPDRFFNLGSADEPPPRTGRDTGGVGRAIVLFAAFCAGVALGLALLAAIGVPYMVLVIGHADQAE